jgi:benzil reductase ((S)-benzoin forming)
MKESLCILTGASRGMGAAIAEQLLDAGHVLLGISRTTNADLASRPVHGNARLEQWPRDLADAAHVADEVEAWLRRFDAARFDEAVLINNAALITRVGTLDTPGNDELSTALRVGLEAPVLLAASFLRATRAWRAMREGGVKILNISSGLGRRAMAGAAPYCAIKAGLDHLSRSVALDEAHRGSGARIVSLAPGVVDTGMQVQLRSSEGDGFPDQEKFLQLHRAGQLSRPHDAAARVLAYLRRPDFGSNPVCDVRDA